MQNEIKAQVLVSLQFGLLFGLLLTALCSNNTTYFPATTFLMLFGWLVLLIAYFNLRPSLRISPIPKLNAPLIARGIYKYIRHPMYFGLLSIGLSLTINSNNTIGWVIYFALLVTLNFKANFEDSLLRKLHPEASYYQIHTSKILPCLGGSCKTTCMERFN